MLDQLAGPAALLAKIRGNCRVAVVGGGRSEVAAPVAPQSDRPAPRAAVPPDPVARRGLAQEEVAHRQVLHGHCVGAKHDDPVRPVIAAARVRGPVHLGCRCGVTSRSAGLGAVDDHPRAVHAPDREPGGRHQDAAEVAERGLLGGRRVRKVVGCVVVARTDENRVARPGSVHRCLDGGVTAAPPVERAHEQHPAVGRSMCGPVGCCSRATGRPGEGGREQTCGAGAGEQPCEEQGGSGARSERVPPTSAWPRVSVHGPPRTPPRSWFVAGPSGTLAGWTPRGRRTTPAA